MEHRDEDYQGPAAGAASAVCPSHDGAGGSLSQDIIFLEKRGVDRSLLEAAQQRGRDFNLPPAIILMSAGVVSESTYYRWLADELDLVFVESTPVDHSSFLSIPSPDAFAKMAYIVMVGRSDDPILADLRPKDIFLAPQAAQTDDFRRMIRNSPALKDRLRIATRTANKASLLHRCSKELLDYSVNDLRRRFPYYSAKKVVGARQVLLLSAFVLGFFLSVYAAPGTIQAVLHLSTSLFYLGCVAIKAHAWMTFHPAQQRRRWNRTPVADTELPDYSILVPVYREEGQISQLVRALSRLNWPTERLEIFLICEADDTKTVAVCRQETVGPDRFHFSQISVPVCEPRTKPKALNYVLPLCRGKFVVVYDAEDRPHPLQLREAHDGFAKGGERLACLQAPLAIRNEKEGFLTRLFAIEYLALFDGVLPALAQISLQRSIPLPLPLGGTSNHFRRDVLLNVGGWDSYNVTEDADLGTRLARKGYWVDTITLSTQEEAPVSLKIWLGQRSRWFKGWYQTWLVHMRHPIVLSRDLGPFGMIFFQLMVVGMAVSALIHPILLILIIATATNLSLDSLSFPVYCLLWLDIAVICLGYLTPILLAEDAFRLRKKKPLRWSYFAIPIHQLLLSAAAWRALYELIRHPHHWEKTPHRLRNA